MPKNGSKRSVSMQTPTTTIRASAGAPSIIVWITPGTPTHSNSTEGRGRGPMPNSAA